MEEKVVHMELKIHLQCDGCYKKVRKILCKLPQIQEQIYDEKEGTILIKVVSSTPEKIMSEIRRKGDRSINSIQIKAPLVQELWAVVEPRKEDQGNRQPPPNWVGGSPMYEGRPSYQYQNHRTPMALSSYYVERPTYNSYGGRDGRRGYHVGQSSNYPN